MNTKIEYISTAIEYSLKFKLGKQIKAIRLNTLTYEKTITYQKIAYTLDVL